MLPEPSCNEFTYLLTKTMLTVDLHSYDELIYRLNRVCSDKVNRCLVAFLFADSGFDLVKKEIFPFLKRFNTRSGYLTHFFFVGYIRESLAWNYMDSECVLEGGSDSEKWYFSAEAFEKFRSELEARTSWKYSGGVDFLLLDAVRNNPLDSNEKHSLILNFDQVVSFDLVDARESKRIPHLSKFFEGVFRCSEEKREEAKTTKYSDKQLLPLCISVAEGAIKTVIPGYVVDGIKNAKQFAVQNLSR